MSSYNIDKELQRTLRLIRYPGREHELVCRKTCPTPVDGVVRLVHGVVDEVAAQRPRTVGLVPLDAVFGRSLVESCLEGGGDDDSIGGAAFSPVDVVGELRDLVVEIRGRCAGQEELFVVFTELFDGNVPFGQSSLQLRPVPGLGLALGTATEPCVGGWALGIGGCDGLACHSCRWLVELGRGGRRLWYERRRIRMQVLGLRERGWRG